jgi:hypothetical protein
MPEDDIDREYKRLIEYMRAEGNVGRLLSAMEFLISADKLSRNIDSRKRVAAALHKVIRSIPGVFELVGGDDPDIRTDERRDQWIMMSLIMLLDLPPLDQPPPPDVGTNALPC